MFNFMLHCVFTVNEVVSEPIPVDYTSDPLVRWDSYEDFNKSLDVTRFSQGM